jgi:hypothetical protein
VGPVLLPEFRDPAAGRLHLFSAGLSLLSVLGVTATLSFRIISGPFLEDPEPQRTERAPSRTAWRRRARRAATPRRRSRTPPDRREFASFGTSRFARSHDAYTSSFA